MSASDRVTIMSLSMTTIVPEAPTGPGKAQQDRAPGGRLGELDEGHMPFERPPLAVVGLGRAPPAPGVPGQAQGVEQRDEAGEEAASAMV